MSKRLNYAQHLGAKKRKVEPTDTSNALLVMLAQGTRNPKRAHRCAKRLLSDYTVSQLGYALYMRCRRILAPPADPAREKALLFPGKPGQLNERERKAYATWKAIYRIHKILDRDADTEPG